MQLALSLVTYTHPAAQDPILNNVSIAFPQGCEGPTAKRQGDHALLDIHLNDSVGLRSNKEGMSLCSSHSRL